MLERDSFIERHILIGLITSTTYIQAVRELWDSKYLKSDIGKLLSDWCLEYYDQYLKAPGRDIEGIYFEKLKAGLSKDIAEELEEDFLPDLSDEYEREEKFNVPYLLDRTRRYFDERNLEMFEEELRSHREQGDLKSAEALATAYRPVHQEASTDINLSDPRSLKRVEKAFSEMAKPLLKYPGVLGTMLNSHLTRDSFVAFLAPEKRGKSFWLMDMAKRGVRQRLNVAFFQAGDMSEGQQIRRIGIHLAKRSDQARYCGKQWEPVKDCIKNQADTCNLPIRECEFGLEGESAPIDEKEARKGLSLEQLMTLKKENPLYRPCHNCLQYQKQFWGCAWIKQVNVGEPLVAPEAVKLFEQYFIKKKRRLMISTHPNNTLSMGRIKTILDGWYRQGFVPDMIVLDYADLLISTISEYRHKQNEIWKDLRSLSEERHCLVATVTQSDANSYRKGVLQMDNFSEDKRKYGHVTAMFGLNQDPEGREKAIGIMRINELVLREGENQGIVHVLQNLKRGQPILKSYW